MWQACKTGTLKMRPGGLGEDRISSPRISSEILGYVLEN
jgi:hypothetical protein